MERGALIGGIAVVGLLALFAAVFVMVGVGDGSSPKSTPGPAPRENVSNQVRATFEQPTERRADRAAKGDVEFQYDANGDPIQLDEPEGLGAEKWAEIHAQKTAEREARARTVIDAFAADMSESDATQFRDIMDRVFTDSSAIRAQFQAGELDRQGQKDGLADLRAKTIEDLTTLLGGERFSQLRTELRRADAVWF